MCAYWKLYVCLWRITSMAVTCICGWNKGKRILYRKHCSSVLSFQVQVRFASCSVATLSAVFKLIFFIFPYTFQYIQGVTLSIGGSLLVASKSLSARNLGCLLMVLCHVVIVVCCLKMGKISLRKFHIYFTSVYYKFRYHRKDNTQ